MARNQPPVIQKTGPPPVACCDMWKWAAAIGLGLTALTVLFFLAQVQYGHESRRRHAAIAGLSLAAALLTGLLVVLISAERQPESATDSPNEPEAVQASTTTTTVPTASVDPPPPPPPPIRLVNSTGSTHMALFQGPQPEGVCAVGFLDAGVMSSAKLSIWEGDLYSIEDYTQPKAVLLDNAESRDATNGRSVYNCFSSFGTGQTTRRFAFQACGPSGCVGEGIDVDRGALPGLPSHDTFIQSQTNYDTLRGFIIE